MCCHWNDTFAVEAVAPQVIFVDANHAGPCQFLVFGCDPEDTNRDDAGHYLEAVDPATGALYWRSRVDIYDVFSALLATGS